MAGGLIRETAIVTGLPQGVTEKNQDAWLLSPASLLDRSLGRRVHLTVPVERFVEIATWLAVNRDGLTIFAHASTGDHVADHSRNVVWFGPSVEINLSIFD